MERLLPNPNICKARRRLLFGLRPEICLKVDPSSDGSGNSRVNPEIVINRTVPFGSEWYHIASRGAVLITAKDFSGPKLKDCQVFVCIGEVGF